MKIIQLTTILILLIWSVSVSIAQDAVHEISARNLSSLFSVKRIDFADAESTFIFGWFEANDDASEFIVFDRDMKVYRVSSEGDFRELPLVSRSPDQVFAVLDALFLYGKPTILYLHDQYAYINHHQLANENEYVAMFQDRERDEIIVEAIDSDGDSLLLRYSLSADGEALTFVGRIAFPRYDKSEPIVRIGRVSFPHLVLSSIGDSSLNVYTYPDAFAAPTAAKFMLEGGPAVFGALNGADASHFAWSDPRSSRLNLLDLASGKDRVVADLDAAYAQYMLLTNDASAIIVVNLDFAPNVFAWDIESGQRFDLGQYRECQRIPDMVSLSADGASLIIGCDSGLDIWKIAEVEEVDQ